MSKTVGTVFYRDEETKEFYQLQCPHCNFPLFFCSDPPFQRVEIGVEITCATCSKTFTVTGNCWKATGTGVCGQVAEMMTGDVWSSSGRQMKGGK